MNDPKVIAKLLRSIAGGSIAKESKYDVVFNAAAELLETQGENDMQVFRTEMLPEDQAAHMMRQVQAKPNHIRVAKTLQVAAGVRESDDPFPVYLEQAFFLLDKENAESRLVIIKELERAQK